MNVRIGYDLVFDVPAPTPMLLLLHTLPNHYAMLKPEKLLVEPETPYELFFDHHGNRCTRLVAPAGRVRLTSDGIVTADGQPDFVPADAVQHAVNELPYDTLQFLLASRYCEVDRMSDFAWKQFGSGPTGYARAQAVAGFVHNHIEFGYGHARSTKTAFDVFQEKQGVCRDFSHLAITLCRCLGIPARYATGYLGDIGVPINPDPMDFSAWFEVFLAGQWFTLDARHNHPRIGRIVMARGRDASETALTTSFGPMQLQKFEVWTDELKS